MKKEKRIEIRIDEFEFQAVKEIADLSGVNVSSCLRQMALAGEVKNRKVIPSIHADLIREAAKIGNNLNQIARWCNTHKSSADAIQVLAQLELIEDVVKGIRDAIKELSDAD